MILIIWPTVIVAVVWLKDMELPEVATVTLSKPHPPVDAQTVTTEDPTAFPVRVKVFPTIFVWTTPVLVFEEI